MALKPSAGSALPKLVPVLKTFADPALANADGSQPSVRMAGPDAEPAQIRGWVDLGDSVAIAAGSTDNASKCINRHFNAPEYNLRAVNGDNGSNPAAWTNCPSRDLPNLDARTFCPSIPDARPTTAAHQNITNVAFVQWEGDKSQFRKLVSNTTAKEFIAAHVRTDRGKALAKEMAQAHSAIEASLLPAGSFAQQAALAGAEDSAMAAHAVPLLGAAASPGHNHHVVSSRGDVNINVGAPAAAPGAAPLVASNHSSRELELKPLPVSGLASEVESVREITGISDDVKNALIESRVGAVLAFNNMIKSVSASNANKAQCEAEIVESRKRHLDKMAELDERHKNNMAELDKRHKNNMAELDELDKSATVLRENGGMTAAASRALARRVLGTDELGTEIRASDDHALERVVQQAASLRTAKEHQELLTAIPVTDPEKLKRLRAEVLRAYKATTGDHPHVSWRKKERVGRRNTETASYPTDWLEGQRSLFARLV